MSKSSDDVMDRLSELPESLILEILSLLEMRDVVKTTHLSKRWESVWTAVPCLDFHHRGKSFDQIRNFVNRALSLWRGTHLRKLSIIALCSPDQSAASLSMDMASWVQFATERKVEELSIKLFYAGHLCPPQCLYECSSLRKLSLYCCDLLIRGDVQWDRLNNLLLHNCVVSEDAMNQVFSSSPQLETFSAVCRPRPSQNWSIRSSSLKKFRISTSQPYVLTIWAPNLDSFKYNGTPYTKCSLKDSASLTEVGLKFFCGSSCAAVEEVLCDLLPAIQHVERVELSYFCLQMLLVIKGKYSLSPLLNVKLLTIPETSSSVEHSDIVGLLGCFPKLEMLAIHLNSVRKWSALDARNLSESEANILKSNSLQLRTVVITCHVFEASFVEVIGFLLKHATMIKKMVIRKEGKGVGLPSEIMSLQRSFPSVELIFC